MFTGIVKATGTVQQVTRQQQAMQLQITAPELVTPELWLGSSIAVNGACLTVTVTTATSFSVDVMPESVKRTNLGQLQVGQRVNLEPALTPKTTLDGHFVLGHVDYCGRLLRRQADQNAWRLFFELPATYQQLVVEKGSITVDGVSLTVVSVQEGQFEVDLIPHSQQVTTLGSLTVGTLVNVETDILGKYVVRQLAGKGAHDGF